MRVTAPSTDARTGGSVGPTAAAPATPPIPRPQGLWARLAAAAVADEVPLATEPAHVDFLRRMAEIDQAYDRGIAADQGATVVDFEAARQRLRP